MERATVRTTWTPGAASARLCLGRWQTGWELSAHATTPAGTPGRRHVEHMLTNPRLCGYRTYRGEILLDDDGQPVIGEWETINTVEEWEAVCAVVAEHKRKDPGRSFARKYPLSGIARCGLCHTKIRGQVNKRWKPGSKAARFTYQCSVVNGGCGQVGRVGEPVDEFVISLVLAEQRQKAADSAVSPVDAWPKVSELAAVEADIAELTQAARTKKIPVRNDPHQVNEAWSVEPPVVRRAGQVLDA
ncbi:recombinase family protein [Streptomyces violaceus]